MLSILVILSCKKDHFESYSSPMTGKVTIHKDSLEIGCLWCYFEEPGINVTAFGPDNLIQTTYSDSTGNYIFNSLPTGTYRLKFTKDNYSFHELYGIQHFGIDTTFINDIVALVKIPQEKISIQYDTIDTWWSRGPYVPIRVDLAEPRDFKLYVTVIYGRNEDLSLNKFEFDEKRFLTDSFNYAYYGIYDRSWYNISEDSILDKTKCYTDFHILNASAYYPEGTKIYFRYYLSSYETDKYFNYDENRWVISSVNTDTESKIYSYLTVPPY
jgi:hypothetical protein